MKLNKRDIDNLIPRMIGLANRALYLRIVRELASEKIELTPEQLIILGNLYRRDGLPQSYFVDLLLRDKTFITRQIDNLEEREIVKRVADEVDRRRKSIYLTDAGHEFIKPLLKLVEQILAEAVRDITPRDLKVFKKVIRKITENLRED